MNALTAAARINQATTPLDDPNATLDDLALLWVEAKGAVLNAQRFLDKVTDRIAADVGTKDEGAFTVHCDHFKVTTNQPINRSVARSEAMDVLRTLPEDIGQAIFTFKPSLNVKLFKDLKELAPHHFNAIARAVTEKPGKVSVKVEALSNEEA